MRGGRVVRLRQGDFDRETAYEGDPVVVGEGFAAAGARWLHVVDLDGARTGVPAHGPVIARIVAALGERVMVEVAGGLRDESSVATVLASGAARAVVGTAALEDPAFAGRLVTTHGPPGSPSPSMSATASPSGRGWTQGTPGIDAAEAIRRLADAGVETFEVTAIDRDGLLQGPDLALYRRLVGLDRGSIIASGGITTLDDLRAVRSIGCTGAIVGRALYEGRLDLATSLRSLAR